MRSLVLLAALAVSATAAAPAGAQQQQASQPAATASGSVSPLFMMVRSHLSRTAEQAPESLYAYRPTEGVRTFGQLLAHIADAHYLGCSAALGTPAQPPGAERNATTKAAIIEALAASYPVCEQAFAQSDADLLQPVTLFGMQMTRLGALTLITTHDWEHYGNLVTYMRINGMVPPSSQGGGGGN